MPTEGGCPSDPSGRISFPLAGTIEAAGKTPGEIEEEIEGRLRGQYLRYPYVTPTLLAPHIFTLSTNSFWILSAFRSAFLRYFSLFPPFR